MNYYDEHDGMIAGYSVVISGGTIPLELLEQTSDPVIFPFDPTNITIDDITELEYYFASIDDFDRAIILRDLINTFGS